MAKMLRCEMGTLPFTYLGVSLGFNLRSPKTWGLVVNKFKSKLAIWH